jgi:hypothetical protein
MSALLLAPTLAAVLLVCLLCASPVFACLRASKKETVFPRNLRPEILL